MNAKNEYNLPLPREAIEGIKREDGHDYDERLRYSVDFKCGEGTPILAARSGKVMFVKDDSNVGGPDKKYWNDGNRIVLLHENGEHTAYEHMRHKGVEVTVGEEVKTGQVIGYSGNTGYSFAPHLHFEVFVFTGPDKEEDYQTLEVKFEDFDGQ